MSRRVLLVDDDREVREALGQTLELADLDPILAGSFIEAKDHMSARFDGVIVTDIRMPGRDGFHLLDHARTLDADLPVILLTGEGDIPTAVEAMGRGAYDFLEKPCAPKDLLAAVGKALKDRAEVLEARRYRLQLESGDAAARMIFGTSKLSEDMRQRLRVVARASAEVLVVGEVGSGTFKLAEVIHLLSSAAKYPFVKRAAAGLTVEALDEALDAASPGSLYLDDVAALPPATQFALLDRLEAGGATRVLAGTTRDLEEEVAEGRFSADLFYRLDLMRVRIPSLRERPEDIPEMFHRYVAQACEQANLPMPDITPEVLSRLMAQDWPGNTRALMNAAMRFAMGLSDGQEETGLGLAEQLARVEKSLLADALRRSGGQATEAARALRLPRKTFYDKLARHGIRAEDYRGE
ncbi:sigma-54-dependent transcriptional regulator [Pelagovum pacificum]|uniref:Sigma-54-dependent Fis family transcriptional regulator n=1 Tax=Pelagovum pacificum TaxID=2588711 RepID=A0A5C5GCX0_9RHOB|nr:sigma-54 dependent transcriptional regulator [Pelagovum pacificum]QQA41198.1 sigma-54-dependent Fis family transcriptional regulator [Pelagovum pacificum]TNY31994.1 sigma-54-dependent Fis family transcriptional regulator [Pelagovum pacificum]